MNIFLSMSMIASVSEIFAKIIDYWYIFAAFYAIMSIITFIVYARDKAKSKSGGWRTRESTLIILSFLGGSLGAFLAMRLLRHKTQHLKFQILVPLSLILHILLVAAVVWLGLFKI